MQVQNTTKFVRIVQYVRVHTHVDGSKEQVIDTFPVEAFGHAHIPDNVWNEIWSERPKTLWGLQARPDDKLDTTKLKVPDAIATIIECTDVQALNEALRKENRKSVVAALEAQLEELIGGEAGN